MSDNADQPEIPIVCPECETRSRIPFSEFEEALKNHNDRLHDGESVASVDPDVFDYLADRLVEDLGLLEE